MVKEGEVTIKRAKTGEKADFLEIAGDWLIKRNERFNAVDRLVRAFRIVAKRHWGRNPEARRVLFLCAYNAQEKILVDGNEYTETAGQLNKDLVRLLRKKRTPLRTLRFIVL